MRSHRPEPVRIAPRAGLLPAVLATLLIGGCVSCPRGTIPAGVPDDFRLSLRKGGGFTGRWQGHTILASGAVWTWRGGVGAVDSSLSHVLPRSAVDSLWSEVLAFALLDRRDADRGNLTARIVVTGAGRTAVLTWSSSLDPDSAASAPEEFYRRAELLVRAHRTRPP